MLRSFGHYKRPFYFLVCFTPDNELCKLDYQLTEYSSYKGCFWNPNEAEFQCLSFHNTKKILTCSDDCHHDCPEHHWKCHDTCIHVNETCEEECFEGFTWACNNQCIGMDQPCGDQCLDEFEIICNGVCVDPEKEKVWICDDRCISLNDKCNGSCCSTCLSCNGTCVDTLEEDVWLCLGDCIPQSEPCDGKCPQLLTLFNGQCYFTDDNDSWECEDIKIPKYKPCHGICFWNTTFECQGICIFHKLPCDGACFNEGDIICDGQCLDPVTESLWQCNGRCLSINETCDDKCPFKSNQRYLPCWKKCEPVDKICRDDSKCEYSQNVREKLCSQNDNRDCSFKCTYSNQCILFSDSCNGQFNCIDRSDEELCDAPDFDYSVLKVCTETLQLGPGDVKQVVGFQCGSSCIRRTFWCNFDDFIGISYYDNFRHCPELLHTLHHKPLCQNLTFWNSIPEDQNCDRCKGNFPGQCLDADFSQGCFDESDSTTFAKCDHELNCSCEEDMIACSDADRTCIHQDLVCDGHAQCPDESDENPDICSSCPHGIGFPAENLKSATFSCKHRYTGRPICAVPCDGRDDLCLNDADEVCSSAPTEMAFLFGAVLLVVTTVAGEVLMLFIRRQRPVASGLSECLFNLINADNAAASKQHFKLFKSVHCSEFFSDDCKFFVQAIWLLPEEKGRQFSEVLCRLEMQHHRGNQFEVLSCIKTNCGSNSSTFHLLKLAENEKEASFLKRLVAFVASKLGRSKVTLRIKFAFLVSIKVVFYYVDFFKDVFILFEFSKYFPLNESQSDTFGFQVFVILAASILLPFLLNVVVISYTRPFTSSKFEILTLVLMSPILPAVAIYAAARFALKKEELIVEHKNKAEFSAKVQKLAYFDEMTERFNEMAISFKTNESSVEQLVQTITLVLLTLVKFSETATVTGLHELFVGGNVVLIVTSSVWSSISILLSHLRGLATKKQFVMSARCFLVQFSFVATSLLCRLFAVVAFFSPALGLFDLMHHWKIGSMEFWYADALIIDVTDDGDPITAEKVWHQLESYSDMTVWTLGTFFKAFVGLFIVHLVVVSSVKIKFAENFFSAKGIRKKLLHILNQGKRKSHLNNSYGGANLTQPCRFPERGRQCN